MKFQNMLTFFVVKNVSFPKKPAIEQQFHESETPCEYSS